MITVCLRTEDPELLNLTFLAIQLYFGKVVKLCIFFIITIQLKGGQIPLIKSLQILSTEQKQQVYVILQLYAIKDRFSGETLIDVERSACCKFQFCSLCVGYFKNRLEGRCYYRPLLGETIARNFLLLVLKKKFTVELVKIASVQGLYVSKMPLVS